MKTVSVIMNCFKRTRWFEEQLNAVENQSHKPNEILAWQNQVPGYEIDKSLTDRTIYSNCNTNLGVWSRFAYALNCRSDYICILDDDTIPGKRWLENCIKTYESNEDIGLLGTVGVIFGDKHYSWQKLRRLGWCEPNEETTQVDIVGHSWFFHRDMLSAFWRDLPPKDYIPIVGEDIHFAHMVQKYAGKGTYVPPHPKDDMELWGSIKGNDYGHSDEGISMTQYTSEDGRRFTAGMLMGHVLSNKVDNQGFKLLETE